MGNFVGYTPAQLSDVKYVSPKIAFVVATIVGILGLILYYQFFSNVSCHGKPCGEFDKIIWTLSASLATAALIGFLAYKIQFEFANPQVEALRLANQPLFGNT